MPQTPSHILARIEQAKKTRATELVLSNVGLKEIIEEIFVLNDLEKLDLRGNQIRAIPVGIRRLTNLKWLDVRYNPLEQVEDVYGLVLDHMLYERFKTKLAVENIVGLQFRLKDEKLPEFIFHLPNLIALNLRGNQLTALPETITKLINLRELYLHTNQLTALPETISKLMNLTTLNLSANQLMMLPDSITKLINLRELNLYSNLLTALPEAFCKLTNLTTLDLDRNRLASLPETISKLTNLTTLDLSRNLLTALPDAIVKLTNLTELNLYANQLTMLPEAIDKLTNLTRLGLGRNLLNSLPETISKLTNLTRLDLGRNQLKTLPEAITKLANLKTLYLGRNQLTALPKAITKLTNLTTLNLSYNQLTALPEAITKLSNLTTLYLGRNQLTALSEAVTNLSNLTTLNLRDNQLTALPEAITKLTNLTTLNLSSNQLTALPEAITKLPNLTTLNLSDNQLTALPEAIADLEKLREFKLDNNPLEHPPKEIVERGIESIRNYFRQVREQGTAPLYEAKLLIVGEPDAGKTTLMKKLLDSNYEVPQKEDSTIGIQVHQGWTFPYMKDEKITFSANLWDFGGQEIQYMTHQFFLTSRALYALVVDDRRDERPALDYWFNIIRLLAGPQTPVLVVLNENQHRSIINFNSRSYREQFADLRIETCEVDFGDKNLNRFHVLRDKIRQMLCELPRIGEPLPAQWIPIRQELEAQRQRNHIPVQEYFIICSHHSIQKESDQLQLSRYLHELGIILHFQDDSRLMDMVILNPQWAADAVYAVLFDKTVQEGQGRFTRNWAFDLWQKKGYAYEERAKLLNLMLKENFEICYKLSEVEGGLYLAPQLLPDVASEAAGEKYWRDAIPLRFRFQYPFMPEGLITRLIVRLHELIEKADGHDLVWKRGVILTREGARARVTQEITRKEGLKVINIAVKGRAHLARINKELLTLIREEVMKIHQRSFPNIRFEQMIPCICANCQRSELPHFYEYSKLLKYERAGLSEIRCDQFVSNEVNVRSLIEGVMETRRALRELAEFDDERGGPGDITINVFSEREMPERATLPEPPQPTMAEDEALAQLAHIKGTLDEKSRREARRTIFMAFGGLVVIWILFAYLTRRFGWEKMELWTFFIISGVPIIAEYAYFMLTLHVFSPKAIYERIVERKRKKNYADAGLEMEA